MISAKEARAISVKVNSSAIESLYSMISKEIEKVANEGLSYVVFSGDALKNSFVRQEVINRLITKGYRCEYTPPTQIDTDNTLKIDWTTSCD